MISVLWVAQKSRCEEEAIIGFVKFSQEDKYIPGARSGWNSVFVQPILDTSQVKPNVPIKWIPFIQKSSFEYFQEVKRQAQSNKFGVAIRRGGKSVSDWLVSGMTLPLLNWCAADGLHAICPICGIPSSFLKILQKKLATVDEAQPPNHKGGLWCFKAAPPAPDCGDACVMEIGDGRSVVFSLWFPKRPQPPKTIPLKSTYKGWVANNQIHSATNAIDLSAEANAEVATTQLDSQSQEDIQMTEQQEKRVSNCLFVRKVKVLPS